MYEYCTEFARIRPNAPGYAKLLFKPRVRLNEAVEAKLALGKDNVATVSWSTGLEGGKNIELRLEKEVEVVIQLLGGEEEEHGVVYHLVLKYLFS